MEEGRCDLCSIVCIADIYDVGDAGDQENKANSVEGSRLHTSPTNRKAKYYLKVPGKEKCESLGIQEYVCVCY